LVHFDDDSTLLIPSAQLQCLRSKIVDPNFIVNDDHDFVCNANPLRLSVSDLVFCFYQNGSSKKGWFRGRIASVDNKMICCDILYDDGEYETNIPIGKRKIWLVEYGYENPYWLDGVETGLRKRYCATKTRAKLSVRKYDNVIYVEICWHGGATKYCQYDEFVIELFTSLKEDTPKTLNWPEGESKSLVVVQEVKKRKREPLVKRFDRKVYPQEIKGRKNIDYASRILRKSRK